MSDNKTLRKAYETTLWVILSSNDGVKKYISTEYFHKHGFKFTVLLNKAFRFREHHLADRFIEENNIKGISVPISYNLKLLEPTGNPRSLA